MNFDLKIVGLLEFRTIARRPTDPDPFEQVKVYFTFYLFHDNSRNQTILRKKSTNEYLNGQKKRTFKSFNFLLFFRVFIYLMHLNYEGWKMSCQQNK